MTHFKRHHILRMSSSVAKGDEKVVHGTGYVFPTKIIFAEVLNPFLVFHVKYSDVSQYKMSVKRCDIIHTCVQREVMLVELSK